MARPVTLFTGQWADLPLADLVVELESWGFDGVELACWGDHFEVDRAVADPGYVKAQRELLERHGLGCWAIGAHLVGQASPTRSTRGTRGSCRPRSGATAIPREYGSARPSG